MVATRSNSEMIETSRKGDRPVEVLLRICETARLLRLSDGRLYAEVPVGDRRETYALASRRFRRWLIHGYRGDCGKVPEYARYMDDWTGTATDLLDKLSAMAGKRVVSSPRWPKSTLSFAKELRRVAPQLRIHDIFIIFCRSRDRRFISVTTFDPSKKKLSPDVNICEPADCIAEPAGGPEQLSHVSPIAARA